MVMLKNSDGRVTDNRPWLRAYAYLTILMLLSPTALAGKIYKWTDANGRTHYGDRPSAHATDQQELRVRQAPQVGADVAVRRERTTRLIESFAKERQEKAASRAAADADKKERKEACERARRIERRYKDSSFLFTESESGERVILEGAAYDEAMAGAAAEVKKWCG